jgi:hypothetical protein
MILNTMVILRIQIPPKSTLEYAFSEALRISRILWCEVYFKFNSVDCYVMPTGNVKDGIKSYEKAIKVDSEQKIAVTN